MPSANPASATPAVLADAVWDEASSGHTTAGTYGAGLWTKAQSKTIAFTGATGLGEIGTVLVWTITGRVLIRFLTCFCSETLVGAATLEFGTATDTVEFIAQIANATSLVANDWWEGTASPASSSQVAASGETVQVSANPILTVGGANITDGTLIFECWYLPITSNGALA